MTQSGNKQNPTAKELGKLFSDTRKKRKLSVEEVCEQSRIHPNIIRDIENGVLDRLDKLYMRNFLKKYSILLGLDTESVIGDFETVLSRIPRRGISLGVERDRDEILVALTSNKLKKVFITALGVAFVAAAAILIIVNSGTRSRDIMVDRPVRNVPKTDINAGTQIISTAAKKEKPAETTQTPGQYADRSITLTLKAEGKVWLRVKEDDVTLFAGIIERGQSRTWRSSKPIKIWTGKAEVLDFTVNNNHVGIIASGVIKNITVSGSGIKIGSAWVTHFD